MDGIGGKKGWEWIFILEGLLTVVVGLASPWMVHDFPDTARFLNERESLLLRQHFGWLPGFTDPLIRAIRNCTPASRSAVQCRGREVQNEVY